MSRRWLVVCGLLVLAILAACEAATPPPIPTAVVQVEATASPVPPTATSVAWPAERLVFTHLEKVWLADGAAPFALTPGQEPALSPDGQRVAYVLPVSGTTGPSNIYVLDLPSGEISQVSKEPATYGPPVWSPDGRLIAFTSGGLLVVSDLLGEAQPVLATDVGAADGGPIAPVWSTDGQTVLCPLLRLGVAEIFAINLSDGQAVRVSYTGGYPAAAAYLVAPQDTTVARKGTVLYVNVADGGTLWAVGMDGSARQRILPELDSIVGPLAISADGTRLAGLRQAPGSQGAALWIVDLTTGKLYTGPTLAAMPQLFRWDSAGQTVYWVTQAAVYRYTLTTGQEQQVGALPPPTPTPTATPLPVEQLLVYYADNAFYQARAYAGVEQKKDIPPSQAVLSGYSLSKGMVAFANGADIYTLQLRGGTVNRLYTFQQEKLVLIEVVWSVQGNALLYTATYEDATGTLGRRVDLGVIRLKPGTLTFQDMRLFTSLTDRSGATPLLFNEDTAEAIVVPWSGSREFTRLDVYDVGSGAVVRFLGVEGDGAAAVSTDLHWAAATYYDATAGRGAIRLYDLTAAETFTRTFLLPEGTYTQGPLRWSPDSQYLAFMPLLGNPEAGAQQAQGIWALRAETLEAVQVVPLENAGACLVGWSTE
jgi:Tol biopolymer transport system component